MFCGAVALGSPIIRVIEVSPRDVRGRFVALPLDFGLPRITQNINFVYSSNKEFTPLSFAV